MSSGTIRLEFLFALAAGHRIFWTHDGGSSEMQMGLDLRIVKTLDNALNSNDLRRSDLRRSMGRRTLTCVRPVLQVPHRPFSGAGWIASPGCAGRNSLGCRTAGPFWYDVDTLFRCISEVQSCPPDCLNVAIVAASMVTSPSAQFGREVSAAPAVTPSGALWRLLPALLPITICSRTSPARTQKGTTRYGLTLESLLATWGPAILKRVSP